MSDYDVSTLIDNSNINKKRKTKSVACRQCHARKVKCSGGQPCSNCRRAKEPVQCTYPKRNTKITVTQSEIEKLIAENKRLKEGKPNQQPSSVEGQRSFTVTATVAHETGKPDGEIDRTTRNPMLGNRPWFETVASIDQPVHVAETADAAFATRFRQVLEDSLKPNHFPRVHYVPDAVLSARAEMDPLWPPIARAKLLVKVVEERVCRFYHLFRPSHVYDKLMQFYRQPNGTSGMFKAKLLAIFALGEAYSCRTPSTSEDTFPGLTYYAQANSVVKFYNERPHIDSIESLSMLCLYSLLMNRRHHACFLASSAVRQAVILGLHHDFPEQQLPDRGAREHRIRVWWTAYTLDRLLASKIGHPVSVPNDDISLVLPSDEGIPQSERGDFLDASYLVATIQLADLSRQVVSSIYGRKKQETSFSARVQKALRDLRSWVESLPAHLQIEGNVKEDGTSRPVKWIHVSFNQYVILATRPILLQVLRSYNKLPNTSTTTSKLNRLKSDIGETTFALVEACIRCARHSYHLLTESWIDGSFPSFDYTYTQYLFSAANVLLLSSVLLVGTPEADSDRDKFESIFHQFMHQLDQNGNFAAREFCQHFRALKAAAGEFITRNSINPTTSNMGLGSMDPPTTTTAVHQLNSNTSDMQWRTSTTTDYSQTANGSNSNYAFITPATSAAAGGAFADIPSLQDFMSQSMDQGTSTGTGAGINDPSSLNSNSNNNTSTSGTLGPGGMDTTNLNLNLNLAFLDMELPFSVTENLYYPDFQERSFTGWNSNGDGVGESNVVVGYGVQNQM